MKLIILSFLICLGCHSVKTDSLTVLSFYEESLDSIKLDFSKSYSVIKDVSGHETVFFTNLSNDVSSISSMINMERFGNQFYFDKHGKLDRYEYVLGSINTYEIFRDLKSTNYHENGTPFVHWSLAEINGREGEFCKIKITTYPRKFIRVYYKKNNAKYEILPLIKYDTFILEGLIQTQSNDTIEIKIEAKQLMIQNCNLSDSIVFFDTIAIKANF
jgi:hypothetical protein